MNRLISLGLSSYIEFIESLLMCLEKKPPEGRDCEDNLNYPVGLLQVEVEFPKWPIVPSSMYNSVLCHFGYQGKYIALQYHKTWCLQLECMLTNTEGIDWINTYLSMMQKSGISIATEKYSGREGNPKTSEPFSVTTVEQHSKQPLRLCAMDNKYGHFLYIYLDWVVLPVWFWLIQAPVVDFWVSQEVDWFTRTWLG